VRVVKESFVNDAFYKGINDYLMNTSNTQGIAYNSFLTVAVRMLINIYGELDIINPLTNNDVNTLKNNLAKYDYKIDDINMFFMYLESYYNLEITNQDKMVKIKNPYFVTIQKMLVDMFICKKLSYQVTDEEVKEFYDLLYTPYSQNPLRVSYNFLMANDPMEIDTYFRAKMKDNVKQVIPKEKSYLNVKAYELLNYSMEDIKNMDATSLDKVNTQVYDYFKIRENAINREYLLEKAIEALERENNKVTSGNGYVDILLLLSIISTFIMLGAILIFIVI
jgi:hypothetical protein